MNSIEKVWKSFLKEIKENGVWRVKDDDDHILEILDNHAFIPNIVSEVLGNQPVTLDLFLDGVGNGLFDINDYKLNGLPLRMYVESLDDNDKIYLRSPDEGKPFIYTYPERLLRVKQVDREDNIVYCNQVDTIINRLKNDIGSNRAVANLYMCGLDRNESHTPCLQVVQALVRDNELSLFIFFRSNDLWDAFPGNMMFLQYLGLKITDELKSDYPSLIFKGIYYNSSSLHVYKGDYDEMCNVVL